MKINEAIFLITGGANGIGKEIAIRMLSKGAKFIAILDYDKSSGVETQDELQASYGVEKVKFIFCDVSNQETLSASFKEAFDAHGRLDVVINNAGVHEVENKTIQVNLMGVIYGSTLAKSYMSKKNGGYGGVLINTASLAGLYQFVWPLYTASKYGVVGFSLALPLSDEAFSVEDVRVSVVCPSFVYTRLVEDGINGQPAHLPGRVEKEDINFLPMSLVVDAFQMMVEDDTMHNKLIRVTPGKGIDFHPVPDLREATLEFGLSKAPTS